ncbi:MAG: hypothetical protein IPK87_04925 [Planctomycetes bacterium]|nr:hypothetical protein [Planctomycetota bacterium]
MDNLKKNLHFVVFGAGILLGIILLGVGFLMRSGQESTLSERVGQLKTKNPASQGDLDAATAARADFDADFKAAQASLRGDGTRLRTGIATSTDTRTFYTDEVIPFINDMRKRWAAMDKPVPLPKRIETWILKRGTSAAQDYWTVFDGEMARLNASTDGPKLVENRLKLRIMEEVTTTCELLHQSGKFGTQGSKVNSFKFEALAFSERSEPESPWEALPFVVDLECSPEFGLALMHELGCRTDLTSGTVGGKTRHGFPMEVLVAQFEQIARPMSLRFTITNDMRAAEGIDSALRPETEQGARVMKQKAEEYEKKDRLVLPVHFAIKLRALSFNTKWKVVAEPTE